MVEQYAIVYTYTGLNKWDVGRRNVAFNKFSASGDTDRNIGQIVSIRYAHWHSSTSSRDYSLRGRLVLSDGTVFDSDAVSKRIGGNDTVNFANTWSSLPTAQQFAQIASVQTIIDGGDETSDGRLTWNASSRYPIKITVIFTEQPPTNYAPRVDSFKATRAGTDGNPSDEGSRIAVSARISANASAPVDQMRVRLYVSTTPEITDESIAYDLTGRISALFSGIENDPDVLTGEYSPGTAWYFVLEFIVGAESAYGASAVQRSFVTLHLSKCPTGGVAIGMFSTATKGNPKFESAHPAFLYGGIAQVGNGWTELQPENGTTPAELGGGALRCRKIENKCIVAGSVLVKPGEETIVLARLPDGYKPESGVFSINACEGANIARIVVGGGTEENAGALCLSWVRKLSDGERYTSDAVWVQCSIEYWVSEDGSEGDTNEGYAQLTDADGFVLMDADGYRIIVEVV